MADKRERHDERARGHGWWRAVILLAVVLAVIVLAKLFGLGQKLGNLQEWIRGLRAWGPVVFIILFIAATVVAVPASALTVAAGALFGSVLGVVYVTIGSVVGATLAFLIGRYFARDAAVRWLSKYEKFRRLDELTEKHGAIIVALARLVPIFPFNLLNYAFGLTSVRFRTYVFWSGLCLLPNIILLVAGTDAIVKAISQGQIPWLLIGALVVLAIFLTLLIQVVRQRLQAKEPETLEKAPLGEKDT